MVDEAGDDEKARRHLWMRMQKRKKAERQQEVGGKGISEIHQPNAAPRQLRNQSARGQTDTPYQSCKSRQEPSERTTKTPRHAESANLAGWPPPVRCKIQSWIASKSTCACCRLLGRAGLIRQDILRFRLISCALGRCLCCSQSSRYRGLSHEKNSIHISYAHCCLRRSLLSSFTC